MHMHLESRGKMVLGGLVVLVIGMGIGLGAGLMKERFDMKRIGTLKNGAQSFQAYRNGGGDGGMMNRRSGGRGMMNWQQSRRFSNQEPGQQQVNGAPAPATNGSNPDATNDWNGSTPAPSAPSGATVQ